MGETEISAINWDEIPDDVLVPMLLSKQRRFAVWPTPVGHDACFEKAGFTSFLDTTDGWDEEFQQIIIRTFKELESIGALQVRQNVEMSYSFDFVDSVKYFFGKIQKPEQPSLEEKLFMVASDDHFGDIALDFGNPCRATLTVGGGHPILWIGLDPSVDFRKILDVISNGRPTEKVRLKWDVLA